MPLIYEESNYKNYIKIIKFKGNFTKINYTPVAPQLEQEILDDSMKFLIVDLKEVTMLTNFGLMQLFLYKKKKAGNLVLINPMPRVKSFLQGDKHSNLFNVFDSFEGALKYFESKYGKFDESNVNLQTGKYIKIRDFLKHHFLLNEIMYSIKTGEELYADTIEPVKTEEIVNQNGVIIEKPVNQAVTSKKTDINQTVIIITDLSIHGKILKKVFIDNHINAEAYSLKDMKFIFNKKDTIISWFFFEDTIELLSDTEIYSLLEQIRNFELSNSLVVSPIIFLNAQIEFDEDALKTFKGFKVELLRFRITDNKNKMFDETIRILKERDELELFLTQHIIIRITRKDFLIRIMTEITEEDVEILKSFIFCDKIMEIIKKIILLTIEIKPLKNIVAEINLLLSNIYYKFKNKSVIYVSNSNENIITKIKSVYPSDSLNVV